MSVRAIHERNWAAINGRGIKTITRSKGIHYAAIATKGSTSFFFMSVEIEKE